MEIEPVPRGTKIRASQVSYATVDDSHLPIGIYRVKRKGAEESYLVVEQSKERILAIQNRCSPLNVNSKAERQLCSPSNSIVHSQPSTSRVSVSQEPTIPKESSLNTTSGEGSTYKTPLQIFNLEVTAALKKKIPNLTNPQIQRIIAEKWSKLNVQQKLVYRNKALILSRQKPSSKVQAPAGIVLPAGWSRSLIRYTDDQGRKRVEVVLTTPSGEKLRTRNELAKYSSLNNISGISPDVFDLSRLKLSSGQGAPARKSVTNAVPANTPCGVVKEVLTGENGMKMVRMVVEVSGEKKETVVPAITGADGALKIALPR